jgi:hypothetical protein
MPAAHPLADRTRPLDQGIRASRVNTGERNIIPDAWEIRLPGLAGKSEKLRPAARCCGCPGQSTLAPDMFTTGAQWATSLLTKASNCPGVVGMKRRPSASTTNATGVKSFTGS